MADRAYHAQSQQGEIGKRKAEGKSSISEQRGKTPRTGGPGVSSSDDRKSQQRASAFYRRSGNAEEIERRKKVWRKHETKTLITLQSF
jgi:hypothetical protein